MKFENDLTLRTRVNERWQLVTKFQYDDREWIIEIILIPRISTNDISQKLNYKKINKKKLYFRYEIN